MAYCPLLRAYGGRERHTESLLVFHLRLCASILQFPVWALSGATWNCTPAKPHAAHLLLFHLSFHFSVSHFHPPPCLCNVMISMLRTSKASPGHQSLRRPVSCLTVSQSADQSPGSRSCWITHSIARFMAQPLTHSVTHLIFFPFICFVFTLTFLPLPDTIRNMHVWGILDTSEGQDTLYVIPYKLKWTSAHFSPDDLKPCLSNCWYCGTETTRMTVIFQLNNKVEGVCFFWQ